MTKYDTPFDPTLVPRPIDLVLFHTSWAKCPVFALYPFNPNGSPMGIAALTSANGRHLAMMPHPERCFMMWQMPWYPKDTLTHMDNKGPSPWFRLFQNARVWCEKA